MSRCCVTKNLPNVNVELPDPATGTIGDVLTIDIAGEPAWEPPTGGTGSVTSITAGTGITCTPNPITTTGTISLTSSSITVTGSTFLTVSGSPVSLGGAVTLTNTALNDYFGTGCWGAGNSISFGAGSTYCVLVGNGCSSAASTDFSVSLGYSARVGGDECISIGNLAGALTSSGPRNIYIGSSSGGVNTSATGQNVFVGYLAGSTQTNCFNSVFLGPSAGLGVGSSVGAHSTICIGALTKTQEQCVIIGHTANATAIRSTAVGWAAATTGTSDVAIGDGAGVSGNSSVGIGSSANVTGVNAVGIGAGVAAGTSSVVIGSAAGTTSTTFGVVIGHSTTSAGTRCVSIGYDANCAADDDVCVGSSATSNGTAVTIGSAAASGNSSVSIGYDAGHAGSTNSVFVGYSTGTPVSGAGNVLVGSLCGGALTTGTLNVFVGADSGNLTAAATQSSGLGYNSRCNGSNSTALGANAYANAANAIALGANVTNTVTDSCLVGDSATYIVKSSGFFQATSWYSCKAGRSSGTQTLTFSGSPVTLTINNTVWTNGCAVSTNNITMPQANTQFSVNVCAILSNIGSPASGVISLRIRYYNGTTTTTLSTSSMWITGSTPAGTAWCCGGTVQTPNVTTAYVFAEFDRTSGSTASVDVSEWALTVKRDA